MARRGKVTVVGAGFYGSTTAQRLAEYDIFDEVVLTDIVEGKPEGLALDMNQSRPVEGFETKVTGQSTGPNGEGYEAIAGSGVIVITAGLPRKPGMSRMDLIGVNARIVRSVTEQVVKHAPEAVVIVVSNPLDEMTALTAKVSGFPPSQVMGQAGMLDTARFSYFVAEKLDVPVGSVTTLTLGSHGDTMVPVPSACTVDGRPLAELLSAPDIDALVQRTRNGGGEIVALLKTGSAFYAPAESAIAMATSYLKDKKRVLPCAAHLTGQYGQSGFYVGVPVVIGKNGVERIIEFPMDDAEKDMFAKSVASVQGLIEACKGIDSTLA
jgi:malate dehydrogenase